MEKHSVSKPLHVLVLARGVPEKSSILNGVFELDQSKALAMAGHKVTLLAIDWRSPRHRRKLRLTHKTIGGVDVISLGIPIGRAPERVYEALEKTLLPVVMRRVFDEVGVPDVVHAHFARQGELGLKIKGEVGIPLVYTEHSSSIAKSDSRYIALARPVWEACDTLIAVSGALAEQIYALSGQRPRVVANVVDSLFLEGDLAHGKGKMHFVSSGNLIARKGFDVLIESFSGMPDNAILDIFGEGPERTRLEKLIGEYGLDERVRLNGQIPRDTMAVAYRDADCFVLASRSETFGVVYAEALSCGLPVVGTLCGGPEDFVTNDVGKLVAIDDVNALRRAMTSVVEERHSAEDIREYARELFSQKRIAGRLTDIYRNVLVGPANSEAGMRI